MAIPLIKEAGFEWPLERCSFCKITTNMWHENTNNPVCESCSKTHKVSELPDHGKQIRKDKRKLAKINKREA